MRKRGTEALLTPDKINGREVRGEERGERGMQHALCVCKRECVCVSEELPFSED